MTVPDLSNLTRMLYHLRASFLAESERVNQLERLLERLCLQGDALGLLERRVAALEVRSQSGVYCIICGEPFNASRSDALYCSKKCRSRAYRERQSA